MLLKSFKIITIILIILVAILYLILKTLPAAKNGFNKPDDVTQLDDESIEPNTDSPVTDSPDPLEIIDDSSAASSLQNSFPSRWLMIDASNDPNALGYPGQRKIIADSKGNWYIAYRRLWGKAHEIFVARLNEREGIWSISNTDAPISALNMDLDQRVPAMAVDSKDTLHITWYGSDDTEEPGCRQIKYSRSTDAGDTWAEWRNIAPVVKCDSRNYWQEHPNMFIGSDDTIYIVWEGKDKENNKHQQTKFTKSVDNGDTWSAWKNVLVSPNNTQSRPTIIKDSKGRLHLVMYSSQNHGEQQINYSSSNDEGETWTEWQNISNHQFDCRHVSIAIDNSDRILGVWRCGLAKNGPASLFYSVLDKDKWSKPLFVNPTPSTLQTFPSITLKADGTPCVVWMETQNWTDFPKEKPLDGQIFSSCLVNNKFSDKKLESKGEYNLYPSLPLYETFGQMPLIYSEGRDLLKIIFKI